MSALSKDADAFKRVLHRQDYSSWHSQPTPLETSAVAADESQTVAKKKRPKTSTLFRDTDIFQTTC